MDCWVSHTGSRRAKQCPMEWMLAVRKRSVVAFDRSQDGPDHTERIGLHRSTAGSQHHVPCADPPPDQNAHPIADECLRMDQVSRGGAISGSLSEARAARRGAIQSFQVAGSLVSRRSPFSDHAVIELSINMNGTMASRW